MPSIFDVLSIATIKLPLWFIVPAILITAIYIAVAWISRQRGAVVTAFGISVGALLSSAFVHIVPGVLMLVVWVFLAGTSTPEQFASQFASPDVRLPTLPIQFGYLGPMLYLMLMTAALIRLFIALRRLREQAWT